MIVRIPAVESQAKGRDHVLVRMLEEVVRVHEYVAVNRSHARTTKALVS